MKQILKYFYRYFLGVSVWQKNKEYLSAIKLLTDKSIYIELSENKFERYLYLFIKFFLLEGYTVYIKKDFRFLGDFDVYPLLMFKEKNLAFVNSPIENTTFKFSDRKQNGFIQLNYDYFNPPKGNEVSLFIPMAMHPKIYFNSYWNEAIAQNKRWNSIFFAGNFEPSQYSQIEKNGNFNIASRLNLLEALSASKNIFLPKTVEEFQSKLSDNSIVVIDTKHFGIPINELRNTLARFNFFLACPGISMPFSHNVIEAISCGTVPIIEKRYAELFSPPLIHLNNAIVFENVSALNKTIEEAFSLSSEKMELLQKNVLDYYDAYLTPKNVVASVVSTKPDCIVINAEAHSTRLMKSNSL